MNTLSTRGMVQHCLHSGIPVTAYCLAFWNTSRGRLSCLEGKKCCAVDWRPLIGHRASWNRSLIYFLQVQTSHFRISLLCMSIPLFIATFPYALTIFLGMICLYTMLSLISRKNEFPFPSQNPTEPFLFPKFILLLEELLVLYS